jgi:hypothetical protein
LLFLTGCAGPKKTSRGLKIEDGIDGWRVRRVSRFRLFRPFAESAKLLGYGSTFDPRKV